MAGANYMGGRRNAVKARVRDTDGKLQKSHFGKQRLNILAKGLGKTLNIASTSSRPGPPPGSSDRGLEISLAHAKRPSVSIFSFMEDNSRLSLPAYIEVPSASTKTAKKASSSRTGSSPSSRSSTSRSSKILQELDMTERTALNVL
ncbi:hypothetical protein BC629DRAFT_1158796 [Irpex lacteus]|nr:hypothetical protein BC629DRAFT_1158796 [Irpex lacteus]